MSGVGGCIDRALNMAGKSMMGVFFTDADFAYLGLVEDLVRAIGQVAVH
jgi:hypothetical protein